MIVIGHLPLRIIIESFLAVEVLLIFSCFGIVLSMSEHDSNSILTRITANIVVFVIVLSSLLQPIVKSIRFELRVKAQAMVDIERPLHVFALVQNKIVLSVLEAIRSMGERRYPFALRLK